MLNMQKTTFLLFGFSISWLISNITRTAAIKGDHVEYAQENSLPFVVSINLRNFNEVLPPEEFAICTGTLITKRHVLTAEHCLSKRALDNIELIIGSVDLENGRRYYPKSWISYEKWKNIKPVVTFHDIAIVTLKEAVVNVKPAKLLLSAPITRPESYVKIAGWGNAADKMPSKLLRTATLNILSRDECKARLEELGTDFPFLQQDLCTASDPWALLDCGDSGGPLLNQQNMVVGINSATCPKYRPYGITRTVWNSKRVNIHASVYYYETFIRYFIKKALMLSEN